MLTEHEARRLLERAAATIEVQPGAPIVATRPAARRWLVPVVATAAVAAAVVAGFTLVDRDHAAGPSRTRVPRPVVPTPLDNGRMPAVLAFDKDKAIQVLHSIGLKVTVKGVAGCTTPGRAVHTEPYAGLPVPRNRTVTLFVAEEGKGGACPKGSFDYDFAWKVLDFVNGSGTEVAFADHPAFYVNGAKTGPDALAILASMSRNGAERVFVDKSGPYDCVLPDVHVDEWTTPRVLEGRTAYTIGFVVSEMGTFTSCHQVDIYTDSGGAIDAMVFKIGRDEELPPKLNSSQNRIASSFVRFARGGTPPHFASTVRLLIGNKPVHTLTATRAADSNSWWVCPFEAMSACPQITEIIAQAGSKLTFSRDGATSCKLQEFAAASASQDRVVVIESAGKECSGHFAVQVFYSVGERITAVNLLQSAS